MVSATCWGTRRSTPTPVDEQAASALTAFEQHRPVLLGIAYRMLGSMWDAEDVLQEAYLRWARTDREQIANARAFLVTVVSRLALDQLRSARVTRESYVGPWLPEPVDTTMMGPLETAELRDSVSFATLHLMEQLSAQERAVFILREAFDLSFDDIAQILETTPANCRQLLSRSRRRIVVPDERAASGTGEHLALVSQFLEAAATGNLDALTELLAHDVVAHNDGGGKIRAALRPIIGRQKVVAFVAGLVRRFPLAEVEFVTLNGTPALLTSIDGRRQATVFSIADGRITAIYAVLNPDKLSRVRGPDTTR